MDDLLGKLNVLVRARLHKHSEGDRDTVRSASSGRGGVDLDREIKGLRRSLDDAFAHEDKLKAQIRELQEEADRHDLAADAALQQGQSDVARLAVDAMKRAQRRAVMLESDLVEHERATQDLLQRVNLLESVVAESRVAGEPTAQPRNQSGTPVPSLDHVLDEMRSTIEQYSRTAEAQAETPPTEAEQQAVDDDLDRRIARLSRR
ncbi:MAG: hypothetical protein IPK19_07875 [Chloroflexi bacterium]|nr:hypothetical protein [Chloroflexota bacterium]